MYLDVMNGRIVCPDCRGDYEREKRNSDEDETADIYLKILPDVLEAMRYIVSVSYTHLPKHDYDYHTEAMDRAMEGGIDDVGLGVLFGLEGYMYEFAGLLMHAEHLEAVHGVGPHTISVPRVKHADDIDPDVFDNSLSDDLFAKIIAWIRSAE